MEEQHAVVRTECALLRHGDKTRERLAGIHRIEEQALAFRHQPDGSVALLRGDRIARAA